MTHEQLIRQLKGNWARVKFITHDQRELFERLYDCFEVIGELETGCIEGKMIEQLKAKPNEMKVIFDRMLNNKEFLEYLSQIKTFSPIKNNTRKNKEVVIIDEKNFGTIIDVIYDAIRCPVKHGKEEYNPRNEKIIRVINRIFYKIVGGARLKYLS